MLDCGEHHVGFDFGCGRAVISIVGEIARGLYPDRCRGEVGWSGVTDCEHGDWYRFVRSPLDDECERRKIVCIEWSVILTAC